MKIWLINPYGPIPSEGWRAYCYALMARALAQQGHEVVWWTSNFSHHFKTFRSDDWSDAVQADGYTIRLVPGPGYHRNVGLGRIWRDWVFSLRCWRRGRQEARPDCIVFSENPLTLGFAAYRLARHFRCAALHHQMDLWPELMVNAAPRRARGWLNALFLPVYWHRRKVFRSLDAATGLAAPYLDVALREAPALRAKPHAVVYNGINVSEFRRLMAQASDAQTTAETRMPNKRTGDIWAVFAGSLGPSYDISTLCTAGMRLSETGSNVHIVIAGDGPLRSAVEAAAQAATAHDTNCRLHYAGKLKPSELAALYAQCDVGLCAYSAASNVEMPDKIYDYTAAGLAVLNSLQGEVRQVIAHHDIGLPYTAGDAEHLLSQLEQLASAPARLVQMAARSRQLGDEYDATVQYAKMVEIIQACVHAARKPPPLATADSSR